MKDCLKRLEGFGIVRVEAKNILYCRHFIRNCIVLNRRYKIQDAIKPISPRSVHQFTANTIASFSL